MRELKINNYNNQLYIQKMESEATPPKTPARALAVASALAILPENFDPAIFF
jgi:hypothetical protein